MPKPPPPGSPFWKVWEVGTAVHRRLYRLTGGKIGGRMGKAPILILHHVGRRSGTRRESPLIYVPDGERCVIIASKGGVDRRPAWFHNLMAADETTIEVGPERRRVRPRVAEGEERERLWRVFVRSYPQAEAYTRFTDRVFPVVVLERV